MGSSREVVVRETGISHDAALGAGPQIVVAMHGDDDELTCRRNELEMTPLACDLRPASLLEELDHTLARDVLHGRTFFAAPAFGEGDRRVRGFGGIGSR